jgi:hypothetical protein
MFLTMLSDLTKVLKSLRTLISALKLVCGHLRQPISEGIVHAGRKSPKRDLDQLAEPAFREMGLR